MMCDNKNKLILQFHITGKCNLHCKHCYREDGNFESLSLIDIKNVIEQYKKLNMKYNELRGMNKKGHINITGGEPFIRGDIKEIINYLAENNQYFSFGILSNGSFINDEIITTLKKAKVSFVQLSIDGDRETHDELRTKGDYERVFNVAEHLERNGIKVYISFTANKMNYNKIPKVAKECRKRRITKLWSDRLLPLGNVEELKDMVITNENLQDYIKTLKKAQGNLITRLLYPKTIITMNRALQFIDSNGQIYCCGAGNSLITVDEFGRIMPCRRMPIYCGDIFSKTLEDVYYNNEVFRSLRMKGIPNECSDCKYNYLCRGGAKCQSYASYENFYRADIACVLKKDILK